MGYFACCFMYLQANRFNYSKILKSFGQDSDRGEIADTAQEEYIDDILCAAIQIGLTFDRVTTAVNVEGPGI